MNIVINVTLIVAIAAALAGCNHKLSKKERIWLANEVTNRYSGAVMRYASGTNDTDEIIASLEDIYPYTTGTNGGRMLGLDICKMAFAEGATLPLERNQCKSMLEEHFSAGTEDQPCGRPDEVLAAYFAAVSEPDASPERGALKDLAVARLDCLGTLPTINISKKARFALILRILQAQTNKPAGVSLQEDVERKRAAWLAGAAT